MQEKGSGKYLQSFVCVSLGKFLEERHIHLRFCATPVEVLLKCLPSSWNTYCPGYCKSMNANS